jgi:hypothetical protein
VTMVAGLRSLAKATELPPEPTVRAPAPDPTCERPVVQSQPAYSPGLMGCNAITGTGAVRPSRDDNVLTPFEDWTANGMSLR